jgi:hypothetical protein
MTFKDHPQGAGNRLIGRRAGEHDTAGGGELNGFLNCFIQRSLRETGAGLNCSPLTSIWVRSRASSRIEIILWLDS